MKLMVSLENIHTRWRHFIIFTFQLVLAAVIAAASAQYGYSGGVHGLGHGGYGGYSYRYHGPQADVYPASAKGLVQHYNGAVTPRDTPSVQAARASHLNAKSHAYASQGYGHGGYGLHKREADAQYSHPAIGGYSVHGYPLADAYPAGTNGLVAHYNGAVTPRDTPAVVAARSHHLAIASSAYAAHGYGHGGYGLYKREADAQYSHPAIGGYSVHGYPLADAYPAGTNGLVAHYNGAVTPPDTPAVVAARSNHLTIASSAYAAHGYGHGGYGLYKREAEAEPSYGGYGYGGLGNGGLGYNTYVSTYVSPSYGYSHGGNYRGNNGGHGGIYAGGLLGGYYWVISSSICEKS
jgi:hypothetical protein